MGTATSRPLPAAAADMLDRASMQSGGDGGKRCGCVARWRRTAQILWMLTCRALSRTAAWARTNKLDMERKHLFAEANQ